MAGMQQVSFTTPGYDYAADEAEIKRRQMMADLLQKQSMEPIDPTRSAGGWTIPISPWEGLAKIGQGAASGINAARSEKMQRDLAEKIQKNMAAALREGSGLLQDQPAQTLQPSLMGGTQEGETGVANIPARPADPMGALSAFARDPQALALGGPLAMQEYQRQALARELEKMFPTESTPGQTGTTPPAKYDTASGSFTPSPSGAAPSGTQGAPGMGVFSATPQQLSKMLMSGRPEMVKAAEAVLAQRKVTALRPNAPGVDQWGNVVTQPTPIPPAGGGIHIGKNGVPEVYPLQNAAPVANAFTAGQAAAQSGGAAYGKLPYDIQTFNTPGAPTAFTGTQAVTQATGAPPPLPYGMQPPTQQPAAPPQAPQGAAENATYRFGTPGGAVIQGSAPAAAAEDLGASLRGNRVVRGPEGGARKPGLPLQDQGESAFQKEYGGELAKSAAKIVEGGDMGRRLNDLASAMTAARQQLQAAGGDVNRLAGVQQSVAQMAQAFGVDPEKLGLPKDAGPLQLMDSITNRMAMGMIGPGGMPANNFSEADREFLINTMAKKTDTPQGFDQKLDLLKKVAARNIEAEQSWLTAEQGGTSHSKWRQEWNTYVREHPLYRQQPQQTTAPQGGSLSAQERAELRALRQRFGR